MNSFSVNLLFSMFVVSTIILSTVSSASIIKVQSDDSEQPQKCDSGAVWGRCSISASGCANSCDNYEATLDDKFRPRPCTFICLPGCDPVQGYAFLSGQSGQVVKVEDCPK